MTAAVQFCNIYDRFWKEIGKKKQRPGHCDSIERTALSVQTD